MTVHEQRYIWNNPESPRSILIKDASYVATVNETDNVQVTRGQSIYIQAGIIQSIVTAGQETPAMLAADVIYNAGLRGGIVLTPGFVNAHSHPPMYLLRSTTLLSNDTATTEESLEVARQIEQAMTIDDQRAAALGDFTEQQKMGTTTVLSHYHTPQATRPAARAAHIRLVDAISVASKTDPSANLEKAVAIFADVDDITSPGLTIHTMERVTPAELQAVKQVMTAHPQVLLTIHCGETRAEVEGSLQKHGKRPVAVLAETGLLGSRLVLSHGVHFTGEEIRLLVQHKVGIVHLPTSNRIHKSGQFNYAAFHAAGGKPYIALGTDSVISKSKLDIISEAFQSKVMHQDTEYPITYNTLFKMMTSNGARVLGMGENVGKILPGYKADIAFWKLKDRGFIPYDSRHPETLIGNMITHGASMVRDVMVNGRFVISNRKHVLVNESKLLADLQQRHSALRKRIS